MRFYFSLILTASLSFLTSPIYATEQVNINQLEQDISDSIITAKITARFTQSHDLNPLKISVSTDNGTVKLSGYVKNKQAFVDALRIAKSTHGVKDVDADELDIKRVNTVFTDAYITAKVEAAVLKAKVLDDESIPLVGINASTVNGVVTLTGHIKNDASLSAILKRTSAIKGVNKIISHLSLNQEIG